MTVVGLGRFNSPELLPIFVGIYFTVLIMAIGSLADVHLNPLISWAVWVVDPLELSYIDSTLYITLQYLGGLLGGWICYRWTKDTFFFQPVPPFSQGAAFFAETFYGGILCLTFIAMPDIHGHGSILSHLFGRRPSPHSIASSLGEIDEDGVITLRSHTTKEGSLHSTKLTVGGRTRSLHQSLRSVMMVKGVIVGVVTCILILWCRGISGGSLNPAVCWGASASHLIKNGPGSVDFSLFVPYSLGPYIAATIAGMLYRTLKRRFRQSEGVGSQVSCVHCGESASLLKSPEGIPCGHWASHAG